MRTALVSPRPAALFEAEGSLVYEQAEEELIAAATRGDQHAFASLIEPIRDRLWSVCFRVCGNSHDAEDALQDTLIATWRNLDRFAGRSRFSTWAYRIAVNASLAVVARRRDIPTEDAGHEIAAPERFDEVLADRDLVQAALMSVPAIFRASLILREIGGLSYEEIAEHQGIPVQTVRSRISRARASLSLYAATD